MSVPTVAVGLVGAGPWRRTCSRRCSPKGPDRAHRRLDTGRALRGRPRRGARRVGVRFFEALLERSEAVASRSARRAGGARRARRRGRPAPHARQAARAGRAGGRARHRRGGRRGRRHAAHAHAPLPRGDARVARARARRRRRARGSCSSPVRSCAGPTRTRGGASTACSTTSGRTPSTCSRASWPDRLDHRARRSAPHRDANVHARTRRHERGLAVGSERATADGVHARGEGPSGALAFDAVAASAESPWAEARRSFCARVRGESARRTTRRAGSRCSARSRGRSPR